LIAGGMYRKILIRRKEFATKTENAIREFKEGRKKLDKDSDKTSDAKQIYHANILEQPYNDNFEIPFDAWNIGRCSDFHRKPGFINVILSIMRFFYYRGKDIGSRGIWHC
jgi:hypothetical protein